ncbi:hypothetical protein GA0074692_0751 [Micromonospora pallida]|uniref:Uncharacterized protein n=1 Tax=Micromonospora pallida TaxID=145854 RepID=A0A1C6RSC2_9ACTN|nr:hypothetical protein [Micromonospora pallida]SCL19974.1 hypothetical protein GA0074692_0751 [Micromonospora pallida]
MSTPPKHQHPRQASPATAAAHDKRLDQKTEDTGSWTVGNDDHTTTNGVTSVVTPSEPAELHPRAAAALLNLLKRVNDRRTNTTDQENQ